MRRSRVSRLRGVALLAMVLSVSACTSMSGLNGKSDYACQAPDGVACDSVAGTYANAIHHTLPGQRTRARTPPSAPGQSPAATTAPGFAPIATPLRSPPRILRLWFKPWEDADHDLYDQGYVYVQIDAGQWLIDHAQRAIRDAYRPLRPPPAPSASGPGDAAPDARPPLPFPPISMPSEDVP